MIRTVPILALLTGLSAQVHAPYDEAPIDYSKRTPTDPVTRLAKDLATGKRSLDHDATTGYLKSLLAALDVPVSTQGLVFSKTSFQNSRISPRYPRAIYFGDDVYVGYVPGGEVLELSAVDPDLGAVFYVLDQTDRKRVRITRRTGECLSCHGSSRTRHWPSHLVRSVYADREGHPRTDAGSFLTTHDSPFEERWGGWYVTGSHGDSRHMGNVTLAKDAAISKLDREAGANQVSLEGRIAVDRYLAPHSDLVALMVLEHQTHMHNLIARAGYTVRRALHLQRATNKALGEPESRRSAATERIIQRAADDVLEYLLFRNESRLAEPIRGTSKFATEFSKRGPKDQKGRSLFELDLETRLFRYPCSYVIYSKAFDAMPKPVLERLYARLARVLSGRESRKAWRMTKAQRTAVREILRDTKPFYRAVEASGRKASGRKASGRKTGGRKSSGRR